MVIVVTIFRSFLESSLQLLSILASESHLKQALPCFSEPGGGRKKMRPVSDFFLMQSVFFSTRTQLGDRKNIQSVKKPALLKEECQCSGGYTEVVGITVLSVAVRLVGLTNIGTTFVTAVTHMTA